MMRLPPRQLNQWLVLLRLLSLEAVHPCQPPVSIFTFFVPANVALITFDISHYPLLNRKTVAPILLLPSQQTKYYNRHSRSNHQPERHDIKRYVPRLQLAGECQTRPSCHELTDRKRSQNTNRQNEKCRSHTHPRILETLASPSHKYPCPQTTKGRKTSVTPPAEHFKIIGPPPGIFVSLLCGNRGSAGPDAILKRLAPDVVLKPVQVLLHHRTLLLRFVDGMPETVVQNHLHRNTLIFERLSQLKTIRHRHPLVTIPLLNQSRRLRLRDIRNRRRLLINLR